MTRKSPTYRMALEIFAQQLAEFGLALPCAICGKPIRPWEMAALKGTVREHMIALAYDPEKYDHVNNMRLAHVLCAAGKTNGKRTIGKLGGDNSETRRAIRLSNGGKKRSGPKIQGQGFYKHPTLVRGVGGRVKERSK